MLKILEILLVFFAIGFCTMILSCRKYISTVQDNIKASNFVAVMGFLLVFYVISTILIAILDRNILTKILMVLFGLSPFVIGPVATYEKHRLYTFVQVLTILISAIYSIKILF